jgi:hypothetical protein
MVFIADEKLYVSHHCLSFLLSFLSSVRFWQSVVGGAEEERKRKTSFKVVCPS